MKKCMMMAGVVLVAAAGAAEAGNTKVNVTRTGGYYSGNGGEFTISRASGFTSDGKNIFKQHWGQTGYFSDIAGSYQSFCLEQNEFTATGCRFTIDGYAVRGGNGLGSDNGTVAYNSGYNSATYGNGVNNIESFDRLAEVTQWVYWQFRTGGLANTAIVGAGNEYNYTPGAGRNADAGLLQSLIWNTENESPATVSGKGLAWRTAALAALAAPDDQAHSPWKYSVKVINVFLTSGQGNNESFDGDAPNVFRQSQLMIIPLPTGAGLAMAGMGLLAIRRRTAR